MFTKQSSKWKHPRKNMFPFLSDASSTAKAWRQLSKCQFCRKSCDAASGHSGRLVFLRNRTPENGATGLGVPLNQLQKGTLSKRHPQRMLNPKHPELDRKGLLDNVVGSLLPLCAESFGRLRRNSGLATKEYQNKDLDPQTSSNVFKWKTP